MPYHREPQTVRRAVPTPMRARLDKLPWEDRANTLFARLMEKSRYFTRPSQQLAVVAIAQWLAGRRRYKYHDRVVKNYMTNDWLNQIEAIAEQPPTDLEDALAYWIAYLKHPVE